MQLTLFVVSTLAALTSASPLLEERQNGAAQCGIAAARANCNSGSSVPFPTNGGGCVSICYCGSGGSHTFYSGSGGCDACVASYFKSSGSTNPNPPLACTNMLNGPCTQNNAAYTNSCSPGSVTGFSGGGA